MSEMPHIDEYIAAMQDGVFGCLALEEAASTITQETAIAFAHRLNAAFQRAQDAYKVTQLRDEEREFAYNVGRADAEAAYGLRNSAPAVIRWPARDALPTTDPEDC